MLLANQTKLQLDNFLAKPSHGLMLIGVEGAGKFYLGRELAKQLLALKSSQELGRYPYFEVIDSPEGKQEIPIDAIRNLNQAMKLKTLGRGRVRRVFIIKDAERLTTEAQNALLKNLEEPATDTVFILTIQARSAILPTITSRVQSINVQPVSLKQAVKNFGNSFSETEIQAAWSLSGGAIGMLTALLDQRSNHPLKKAVDEFKDLLKLGRYERLAKLDQLEKNKVELASLLDAGSRILAALHKDAIRSGNLKLAKKLLVARKKLTSSNSELKSSVSARLLILDLVLSLPV